MTIISIIIAAVVCTVVYGERNGGIVRDTLDSAFGFIVPASIGIALLASLMLNVPSAPAPWETYLISDAKVSELRTMQRENPAAYLGAIVELYGARS